MILVTNIRYDNTDQLIMILMSRHDYFTISSPGAPPQPVICGTMQVILMIVIMIVVMVVIIVVIMIVVMVVIMILMMMIVMKITSI